MIEQCPEVSDGLIGVEVHLVGRAFSIGPEMKRELIELHGPELEKLRYSKDFKT